MLISFQLRIVVVPLLSLQLVGMLLVVLLTVLPQTLGYAPTAAVGSTTVVAVIQTFFLNLACTERVTWKLIVFSASAFDGSPARLGDSFQFFLGGSEPVARCVSIQATDAIVATDYTKMMSIPSNVTVGQIALFTIMSSVVSCLPYLECKREP